GDPGQPRAGVEIEAKTLDLILVRGVTPRVVRGVAVDDEEATEALASWTMFEKGPAHPGPMALLVKPGQRRVPGDGEKRFEVDARVHSRVHEQDVAGAPAGAQGGEPGPHALRQRRARRGQKTVETF